MNHTHVSCACPICVIPARKGAFYAMAMRFFAYCFFYFYYGFYGRSNSHPQRTQAAAAVMKVA